MKLSKIISNRKSIIFLISIIMICSYFIYTNLKVQYTEAEIIRKLAGLRISLELYKIKFKSYPTKFEEVIKNGYLEDIPEIKLKWHFKNKKIKHYNSIKFNNSGTWAYVNNPYDDNFGTVYIDSTGKDSKGRYWSWL